MKLFIDDIPIDLISVKESKPLEDFDVIIEGGKEKLDPAQWFDDVLVSDASPADLITVFKLLNAKKIKKVDSLTISVRDLKAAKTFVKNQFTIIKAAGGLVSNQEKVLLIYRLKKWDLPKGKLEKGEKAKPGAVREVEEECNIKVQLREKICSTWHSYTRNGKKILKKTNWYLMDCIDDSELKPQVEEEIEDVRWMEGRELISSLYNSYPSIRWVFKQYYKMIEVQSG